MILSIKTRQPVRCPARSCPSSADHTGNLAPELCKAKQVNYGSHGKDVIYAHIPQLLRKAFTRDDVDSKQFNAQVWPVDKRFKQAIEAITRLNQAGGLSILEQVITFNPNPYAPSPQINFVQHASGTGYEQNLDFGNAVCIGYAQNPDKKYKKVEKKTVPE